MDDSQINITISARFIERMIYWIIIIALGVLLIMGWLKDADQKCDAQSGGTLAGTQNAAPTTPTTPNAATPEPPAPEPSAPEVSCHDATKNGNETDVDCGGNCPLRCANNNACAKNSDCVSNICNAGKCSTTAPVTLSGKIELDLTQVETQTAPAQTIDGDSYKRYKIMGVSYTITNGLNATQDGFVVKIFVKNKAGTQCLNQQTTGTCDDPYATFSLGKLAGGKTLEESHTFESSEYTTKMGKFLLDGSGYDPADRSRDEFNVIMYLYDANGEQIGSKTISDSYTVSP